MSLLPAPPLTDCFLFDQRLYYTAQDLDLISDTRYIHDSFFFFFLYLIRTLFNKRQDACIIISITTTSQVTRTKIVN